MRILSLDDERAIGQMIARVAAGVGIEVKPTTSAGEFWSEYRAATPDLVILDLRIGNDDGVEQLRALSAENYRGPIILMSGFDDRLLAAAQQVGKALGLTIAETLSKPVRTAD